MHGNQDMDKLHNESVSNGIETRERKRS